MDVRRGVSVFCIGLPGRAVVVSVRVVMTVTMMPVVMINIVIVRLAAVSVAMLDARRDEVGGQQERH